jgi:hypothetical protein
MSHTLHRSGTEECLKNDFPMLAMSAKDINREGSAPKLLELARIVAKYKTANAGVIGFPDKITPENIDQAKELITDTAVIHAVFTSEEELVACLKELKEAELGLSVTVSGLFNSVHECCHKADLEPHTVNNSLGVWGNTEEKLPSDDRIKDISSMCGHGMVPFSLVEDVAEKVKAGRLTPKQGAAKLMPACTCHIFNPERAERILKSFVE